VYSAQCLATQQNRALWNSNVPSFKTPSNEARLMLLWRLLDGPHHACMGRCNWFTWLSRNKGHGLLINSHGPLSPQDSRTRLLISMITRSHSFVKWCMRYVVPQHNCDPGSVARSNPSNLYSLSLTNTRIIHTLNNANCWVLFNYYNICAEIYR